MDVLAFSLTTMIIQHSSLFLAHADDIIQLRRNMHAIITNVHKFRHNTYTRIVEYTLIEQSVGQKFNIQLIDLSTPFTL